MAWTPSLFLFIVFVCLLAQVVDSFSTPAVAYVESERWNWMLPLELLPLLSLKGT